MTKIYINETPSNQILLDIGQLTGKYLTEGYKKREKRGGREEIRETEKGKGREGGK